MNKQPRLDDYADEDQWFKALCDYITALNDKKRAIEQKLKKASTETDDNT